jgi:hypothetical protein
LGEDPVNNKIHFNVDGVKRNYFYWLQKYRCNRNVTNTMHFQGEISTLSFGLHFDKEHVSLSGTLWPRRPPSHEPRPEPLRLHFSTLFTVSELHAIQQWLMKSDMNPLSLSGDIRLISRVSGPDAQTIYLDLEFRFEQVPAWWDWPVSFPLKGHLEIRPNEFTYLTRSLSHEQWSADLTW